MADEDDTSTESPRFFDARQSIESKHETTHSSDTSRSAPQHGPDNPFSGEWLSNLIGELSLVVDPYRWSCEMALQQSTLCAQVTFGILNCGELLKRLLGI